LFLCFVLIPLDPKGMRGGGGRGGGGGKRMKQSQGKFRKIQENSGKKGLM